MLQKGWVLIFAGWAIVAFAQIGFAQAPEMEENAQKPGAFLAGAVAGTATVEGVDYEKRPVTLTLPDGAAQTFNAGPALRKLGQVEVGDQVTVSVAESVAIFIEKSGALPAVSETETVILAPEGAKPGIFIVKTRELILSVEAIDYLNWTATLKGPGGNTQTLKIGSNMAGVERVKAGVNVVGQFTEVFSVTVAAPRK